MTIGPDPQKGKGVEEMVTAVSVIKARGVVTCPFSQGLGSSNKSISKVVVYSNYHTDLLSFSNDSHSVR
jgi:hypothetical protein